MIYMLYILYILQYYIIIFYINFCNYITIYFCSELNLAVAAHVSDRITDEVIESLSRSYKNLVCIYISLCIKYMLKDIKPEV